MDGETGLSGEVVRAAVQVHRHLGPGLLESAYRACLVQELVMRGLLVESEVALPVSYRGVKLECGYRIDLLVERRLIVELKSVQALDPLHTAQLMTYLRLFRKPLGLLINFNVRLLKHGIRRVILTAPASC